MFLKNSKNIQQDKNLLYFYEHPEINFRYPTDGPWTSYRNKLTQY